MLRFSQHKLTVYRVQTMHHRALYLDQLPYAIKKSYENIEGITDLERELFVDTSLAWELGEIETVGYVGLYHLWERYSKDFLTTALGIKYRKWPKPPNSAKSYPQIVAFHLETQGVCTDPAILSGLIESTAVVNAYKHGDDALEHLATSRPEYFADPNSLESFHIPSGKLANSFETVERFWSGVDQQIELIPGSNPDFS